MYKLIPIIVVQVAIQAISLLTSLFFYYKTRLPSVFILSVILLLSLTIECIGLYLMITREPSFIFHFIYVLLNFLTIIYFYWRLINDNLWFKLIKGFSLVFIVFWFYTFFNSNLITYSFILESLIIAVSVLFYLRQILLSDKILNYKKLLPFWVSVGFLVFYLPSIPFLSLLNYMQDRGLFFILNILIILMNVFIIYGLICSNKEEKY